MAIKREDGSFQELKFSDIVGFVNDEADVTLSVRQSPKDKKCKLITYRFSSKEAAKLFNDDAVQAKKNAHIHATRKAVRAPFFFFFHFGSMLSCALCIVQS
jgi:hypothetical protein